MPARRLPFLVLALLGALAFALPATAAAGTTLSGTVKSGRLALPGVPVSLYRTAGAHGAPQRLGNAITNGQGAFKLSYKAPSGANAVLYVVAGDRSHVRLAATLGAGRVPRQIVVNELTTAATGYAFAQFTTGGWKIGGPAPGPRNAALMARNLANPRTGRVSAVLLRSPNGSETTTLAEFRSVANTLSACARAPRSCGQLLRLTHVRGHARPTGTLQAVADIAKFPWHNVKRLRSLALGRPAPYRGALKRKQQIAAWTLPVRFVGDGRSLDGPGNFAIDGDGNVYVANNYGFGKNPLIPRCGSHLLPVFGPDGRYLSNTPFTGGGLDGAGYGIGLDPRGNIWVGNFGFAAPAPKCPERLQPPHNSVSVFSPDGRSQAGDTGIVAGDIFWPQGTVSDQRGNIWVANCGNGKITRLPAGNPTAGVGLDVGLTQAFDLAVDGNGLVYATGLGNSKLAILNPDGSQRALYDSAQLGLKRPMGIASDSRGNMWIANSGLINLPCPEANIDLRNIGGSVSLVGAGGRPVTHEGTAFTGGGLSIPWGIAVDGNDNVWVANFARKRVSEICGVAQRNCRPGSKTGDGISPDRTGYRFNGFTRVTAVEIDPSGNVWAANNWKQIPIQTNPGAYEVVVLVGAAGPLKTPLIGPPVPLMR